MRRAAFNCKGLFWAIGRVIERRRGPVPISISHAEGAALMNGWRWVTVADIIMHRTTRTYRPIHAVAASCLLAAPHACVESVACSASSANPALISTRPKVLRRRSMLIDGGVLSRCMLHAMQRFVRLLTIAVALNCAVVTGYQWHGAAWLQSHHDFHIRARCPVHITLSPSTPSSALAGLHAACSCDSKSKCVNQTLMLPLLSPSPSLRHD
jgi:hypothetical protein